MVLIVVGLVFAGPAAAGAGRIVEASGALGNPRDYSYDLAGQFISVRDEL